MKKLLCVLLFLYCGTTQAAKVHVELTTPAQNEDGTTLTDLASITVEWGTCAGSEFGVRQAAITIQISQTNVRLRTSIYPTGLSRVCARAFAVNSKGAMSEPSNVAWKDLIGKPGQPVRLGEVLEIHFNEEKPNG